jgi:hypothetical protein
MVWRIVFCGLEKETGLSNVPQAPGADQKQGPTWLCVGCGYDLRGSDRLGNCPECGKKVSESEPKGVDYQPIEQADPAWVLTVATGLRLAGVCMALYVGIWGLTAVIGVAAVVVSFGAASLSSTSTAGGTNEKLLMALAVFTVMLFILARALVMGVGALSFWKVSRPEPGRVTPAAWEKIRRQTQVVVWITVGLMALELLGCGLLLVMSATMEENGAWLGFLAVMYGGPIEMGVFALGLYGCAHACVDMAGREGSASCMESAGVAKKVFTWFGVSLIVHVGISYLPCFSCLGIFTGPVMLCLGIVATVVMCRSCFGVARAVEAKVRPVDLGNRV